MTHRAYVGVGSNLGDPATNVECALAALEDIGMVRRRSALYATRAWGRRDQPDFVNAVALLETALNPRELLTALQAIEVRLGRKPGERWGPRAIDLDLLLYDDLDIDEPDLRVPHRHLCERAFVLVPLAELDARYRAARDALAGSELATVARLPASPQPKSR